MKPASEQGKEEDITLWAKISSNFYLMFCGEPGIDPAINRSIICNVYCQLWEFVHIVCLYTTFNATNNLNFNIFSTAFSVAIIVICIIPHVSKKHIVLNIVAVLYLLLTIGSTVLLIILIQNYTTFMFYCKTIGEYAQANPNFNYELQPVCAKVKNLYVLQLSAEAAIFLLRVLYLGLIGKAYRVASLSFSKDQLRRRRKDKYNELLRKKNVYNQLRKV